MPFESLFCSVLVTRGAMLVPSLNAQHIHLPSGSALRDRQSLAHFTDGEMEAATARSLGSRAGVSLADPARSQPQGSFPSAVSLSASRRQLLCFFISA